MICRCNEAVDAYIEDKDGQAVLNIGGDMRKIQLCYSILKVGFSNTHVRNK